MIRLSVLAAALAAAALAPFARAEAGSASFALLPQHYDPSLPVSRSYFVAQARPGETYTNSIRIRNVGSRAGTALLYPVDATTGQTSGAVYLDRTKPRHGVGAWITLGARSVTLGPGRSRIVPFTVHVPANARPGDHLGGIVAENAAITGSRGKGALRIRVRRLTITALEVQIPGAGAARVDPLAVRAGGEHGYQYLYVRLDNRGALTTRPWLHVAIADAKHKQVAERSARLDTFLPASSIDYPVLLPGNVLEPGTYAATVELTYGATVLGYRRTDGPSQTVSRTFSFVVTAGQNAAVFRGVDPVRSITAQKADQSVSSLLWVIFGLGAVVLVLAVALIRLRRRA